MEIHQFSKLGVILTLTFAILLYIMSNYLQTRTRRRTLTTKNSCKDPPQHLHKAFLGLDLAREIGKQFEEKRRLVSLQSLYEKYGTTYKMQILGQTQINTIAPENLRAIYATSFQDFVAEPARMPASGPAIGRNIFTTDGEFWQRSRTQVMPIFTRAHVSDLSGFEPYLDMFMNSLPSDGIAFDASSFIDSLFIDSALDFLFGIPMSSQTKESDAEKTKILAAFQEMFLGMSRRVRRGKLRVFYRDAKFDKACSEVQEFATKYVTQAMEVVKKKVNSRAIHGRYIFVHEMARTISDPIFIRDNLLAVYLAGHESIATLLKNCMFHVFRRPDVWNKLRQEVLSVDKDQPVTFEFLKSLRYLHWVVNESLRMHPVVVNSTRMAVRDTILPTGGGEDGKSPILIQKGWMLQTHPYSLHRSKATYENADEFIPERWEHLRQGWQFLPFSGGPRICPAQQMALTEATYTMFCLAKKFKEIRSEDSRPWTEAIALTVWNVNGVRISLVPA